MISVSTLFLPEEQTGTFQKQCSLGNGGALAKEYFDSVNSGFRRDVYDDYAGSSSYSLPLRALLALSQLMYSVGFGRVVGRRATPSRDQRRLHHRR